VSSSSGSCSQLGARYAAYVADAKALAFTHRFRTNFGDCLPRTTNGELSWNHNFRHLRQYSLADARGGMLGDNQAAGRVYCTFARSQFQIVWTMDDAGCSPRSAARHTRTRGAGGATCTTPLPFPPPGRMSAPRRR
jgi:hypothetical protein